ncbi:uncharacterized protein EV422DRAFT_521667 [Fimicolochytrium jonesii]|uniref:uncharacterized protein n=1 Tax=Fimicolochytrium jonesii TaxID=1396493 RepID=UPI0022FDE929|nr:uncharacterized protein EV422DRAFT_521667 [Fimicolochytrium jonesii]KAI8823620.1 hypothetical protein EV422DRAFT_521667 [Fimicolochytrium jonesii]
MERPNTHTQTHTHTHTYIRRYSVTMGSPTAVRLLPRQLSFQALVLLVVFALWSFEQVAAEPVQYPVLHSIGRQNPVERGHITVDAASTKRSVNKYVADDNKAQPAELVNKGSSGDQTELYRVSVQVGQGKTLSAAVPVCLLKASNFREQITLHLDSEGKPWHLDYLVSASTCGPSSRQTQRPPRTQVFLERAVVGARPRLEQIVENTPDGKAPPEPTFLQKYWYYIIPVVLMVLLSGQEEPAKK